jgi:hypothetical protein
MVHPAQRPDGPAKRPPFLKRHGESIRVLAFLAATVAVAYPDVVFRGYAISPADLLYRLRPWSDHLPPGMNPGANPVLSDVVDSITPQAGYLRECLRRGEIPFWCDKIQNGTPFFFVIRHNLMVLPLAVLLGVCGVAASLTIYCLGRHVLGGFFFYRYCRALGLASWPSLCGMLVFSYGSFAVQVFCFQLGLQYNLLPVAAYGIERIVRDGSRRWMGLLPFVFALIVVAGFPAGSFYGAYFLALYALFRICSTSGARARQLGYFALAGLVTVMLCAPALLATADFFSDFDWSYRAGHWRWHFTTANLLTYLFPFIYGPPSASHAPLGSWYEYGVYFGALPLLVVTATLAAGGRGAVRCFYLAFAAWLVVLLYDVGGVLEKVVQHLPVLGSSPNTRQKLLLAFVVAVLAAFGFEALRRGLTVWGRRGALITAGLVLAAAGWAAAGQADRMAGDPFVLSHVKRQVVVLMACARRIGQALKWCVVGLIFFELQYMDKGWYVPTDEGDSRWAHGWNPTIQRSDFFPRTPAIDFLRDNIGEHKLLCLGRTFLPNTPMYYDLNVIGGRGFFDQRTRRLFGLISPVALKGHATQFLFPETDDTALDGQIIDALGVKYVAVASETVARDLSRKFALRQPEWNGSVELPPGGEVGQSFVAPRSLRPDRFEVRAVREAMPDLCALRLIVEDAETGEAGQFAGARYDDATGRVGFDLSGVRIEARREYLLTLAMDEVAAAPMKFLIAENVDVLRGGQLFVGGEPRPSDLTCRLYAEGAAGPRGFQTVWTQDLAVLENAEAFGRAWLVGGVRVADDDATIEGLRSGAMDLRHGAWVEPTFASVAGKAGPPAEVAGTVRAEELRSSSQRFAVESADDALLIVSDNYDPGWRATIDGKPAEVFRANYNMRGLRVPAGAHTVEFRYRPHFLMPGVCLSVVALLAWLGGFVVMGRGRKGRDTKRAEATARPPDHAPLPDESR